MDFEEIPVQPLECLITLSDVLLPPCGKGSPLRVGKKCPSQQWRSRGSGEILLSNLVKSTLKFTHEGGVTLFVRCGDGPADRHAGFRRATRASTPRGQASSVPAVHRICVGFPAPRRHRLGLAIARVLVQHTWWDNPCARTRSIGGKGHIQFHAPASADLPQSHQGSESTAPGNTRTAQQAPGPARRGCDNINQISL